MMMSALSRPLEKYSALLWPKACSSSGGRSATVSAHSAAAAATRLTSDSAASEKSPTDPVSRYAPTLRPMVNTAAAIESTAYHQAALPSVTAPAVTSTPSRKARFADPSRTPMIPNSPT
jgi:hypothetical protein